MTGAPAAGARPRLVKGARLRWCPVRQKPILLLPERVLVLNRTAHEIVKRIDGTRTVQELASELAAEFKEPRVEAEVVAFLTRLATRGLLEEGPPPPA
jgi:pyrroloquinoline quinone biosynthesis protein D